MPFTVRHKVHKLTVNSDGLGSTSYLLSDKLRTSLYWKLTHCNFSGQVFRQINNIIIVLRSTYEHQNDARWPLDILSKTSTSKLLKMCSRMSDQVTGFLIKYWESIFKTALYSICMRQGSLFQNYFANV